jgi:hypothetical protein
MAAETRPVLIVRKSAKAKRLVVAVLASLGWFALILLERVRFELNHDRALSFSFDAFSSREPVSTSLENALAAIRPVGGCGRACPRSKS